jgi:hypothetical protein
LDAVRDYIGHGDVMPDRGECRHGETLR